MARLMIVLTGDEVREQIAYAMICETRESSIWNTMRRKRKWKMYFTDAERKAATNLFKLAHTWTLTKGVPNQVMMASSTYDLWQKLEGFCGSL